MFSSLTFVIFLSNNIHEYQTNIKPFLKVKLLQLCILEDDFDKSRMYYIIIISVLNSIIGINIHGMIELTNAV